MVDGSDRRPPGVILAGGLSRRMGADKSETLLAGISLLDRVTARLGPQVSSVTVNSNIPRSSLETVPDPVGDHAGPLAGVLAALRHHATDATSATHVATVPTDTPFFPRDLVARLQQALMSAQDIAIAFSGPDMHPIFGLWPVALTDDLEHFVKTDEKRRVRAFIARHTLRAVDFPLIDSGIGPLDPFFNINTPADLARATEWLPFLEANER